MIIWQIWRYHSPTLIELVQVTTMAKQSTRSYQSVSKGISYFKEMIHKRVFQTIPWISYNSDPEPDIYISGQRGKKWFTRESFKPFIEFPIIPTLSQTYILADKGVKKNGSKESLSNHSLNFL